jgi:hypothetical protein
MPRGVPVKTPERVALAMDLRREGWLLREIAAHFEVSVKTIDSWLQDPNGFRMARRRRESAERCSGSCEQCGARTDGSRGRRNAAKLCATCVVEERRIWTRDAVLLAMQEWAEEYGELPAVADWNPYQAEAILNDLARAERFRQAEGRWPSFRTVYELWGSWNTAIEAAGGIARAPHGGNGNLDRRRDRKAVA